MHEYQNELQRMFAAIRRDENVFRASRSSDYEHLKQRFLEKTDYSRQQLDEALFQSHVVIGTTSAERNEEYSDLLRKQQPIRRDFMAFCFANVEKPNNIERVSFTKKGLHDCIVGQVEEYLPTFKLEERISSRSRREYALTSNPNENPSVWFRIVLDMRVGPNVRLGMGLNLSPMEQRLFIWVILDLDTLRTTWCFNIG